MTTRTTQDTRYPRSAVADAITAAMEGTCFTSTAEWEQPPGCRCRREGVSCLAVQAQACVNGGVRECQGYVTEQPVQPDHSLTAEQLIAVLPACDTEGMVSGQEAASAMTTLITGRLAWNPVWMSGLAKRLAKAFEELEDTLGTSDNRQPAVPGYRPSCMHCGQPIPAERGPRARFCKPSHRVAAAKRKRAARVAAEAGRALPVTFPGRCPASSPACWSGGRERPPDQHRITRISGPVSLPAGLPATGLA